MPPEPSVTSACEGPRFCTLRYSSALLPKSFERPGPKAVSPATYCSGVEVVVWCRRIVECPLSLPGTSGILSLVLITHLGPFCTCAACRFESDASATADHNNRLPKELRFTVDGRGDSDGRGCAWGCAHKDLHSN